MSLRRILTFAALAALAAAYAWPMQGQGANETSQYALVKALSSGTAAIDKPLGEIGDVGTVDVKPLHGHVYSNKGPGLAFVSVPVYLLARAAGARTTGDPTRMLWVLSLWGAVLPATVLLVLVAALAERLDAGVGTATAVILGAGTLLLPFASLFHAHVFAAALLFAAFALLWRSRSHVGAAVAGALAGYSVSVEYSTAAAVAILGVYAFRPPLRGGTYAAGALVGLIPLGLYNLLAFGSVTELSYSGATPTKGASTAELLTGVHLGAAGLLETLFSMTGLLVLAPVLACSIPGIVLLYRRGLRAEALVIGAVSGAFVLYNGSLGTEFDAYSGGQRYMIVALGFLVLPIALTLRRLPLTVGALTLVSTLFAAGLAAGHVRTGHDPAWFAQVLDHRFPGTAAEFVGITGWYAFLPYFAALAFALVVSFGTARLRPARREPVAAGAATLAWAGAATLGPNTAAGATALAQYDHLLPIAVGLAVAFVWTQRKALVGGAGVDPSGVRL